MTWGWMEFYRNVKVWDDEVKRTAKEIPLPSTVKENGERLK